MKDKCQRIADDVFKAFGRARVQLNSDATLSDAYGGSRHRMWVNEARKDHLKDGLERMARLVLAHSGRVTNKGITAVRRGGESLRDLLITAYEAELLARATFPDGLGSADQRVQVNRVRGELDAIFDNAITDFKNGLAGDESVIVKGTPRWERWLEGIGISLTAAIIWTVGTVGGVIVLGLIIKLVFGLLFP